MNHMNDALIISKNSLNFFDILILYSQENMKINMKRIAQNNAKFINLEVSIVWIGKCTPGIRSVIRRIDLAKKNEKKTIKKSRGSFIAQNNISCFFTY